MAFLGLVAAGVITVASAAVLAIIAGIALVAGAIAGAFYVVLTGRVDAWQIVLLGFGAASLVLVPAGLMLRFPQIGAFFSSIPARIAALWSQRIAPFLVSVWNGIKSGWQWVWRNLDTKFRPFPLPWEIKITDVISNLIKYFFCSLHSSRKYGWRAIIFRCGNGLLLRALPLFRRTCLPVVSGVS